MYLTNWKSLRHTSTKRKSKSKKSAYAGGEKEQGTKEEFENISKMIEKLVRTVKNRDESMQLICDSLQYEKSFWIWKNLG